MLDGQWGFTLVGIRLDNRTSGVVCRYYGTLLLPNILHFLRLFDVQYIDRMVGD